APNAHEVDEGIADVTRRGGWRVARPLLIGLAVLMVLSPLGLLAVGTAWGEWGASDYADPAMRQQIIVASGQQAPPAQAPKGLAQLSSIWTAPIPDYAPPWMQSAEFGYIMSAIVGAGLIILVFFLLSRVARLVRHGRGADRASRAGTGNV
ncbi:MAG TPA: PDGLE domain-containing protein, partial [Roseiflexaceae bacterium]